MMLEPWRSVVPVDVISWASINRWISDQSWFGNSLILVLTSFRSRSMIRCLSKRCLIDQQYRTLFQCLVNCTRSSSSSSNNGTTDEDEVDLSTYESTESTEEEEEELGNTRIGSQTPETESAFASNEGLSFFEGGTGFGTWLVISIFEDWTFWF